MSRRDRGRRGNPAGPPGGIDRLGRPATTASEPAGPTIREQLQGASAAELALLPIRFFFGVTFVYAGLDKLVDPSFFDASNPASIVAQLDAFTRVSPLAPLIRPVEPFAIPLGLLIALAEIAVGLGALTGLAYRLAAAGGAALSLLFWLTASWSTHPYYYGADLPYAVGWVALAIAGHGDLLVPAAVRRIGMPGGAATDRLRGLGHRDVGRAALGAGADAQLLATRRLVLQAAVLGGAALAVASFGVPLRLFRRPDQGGGDGAAGLGDARTPGPAAPSAAASAEGAATASVDPAFVPSGLTVASVASVDAKGAVRIRVPVDAPPSLPAGDPAIIVKLQDGTYAAFDAICTHEGCKVGWDARDGVMLCPCHGAAFDPNDHGAVLQGPTNMPLPELPIVIDQQAGTITLRA